VSQLYKRYPGFERYVKKRGGIFNCTVCHRWHYHDSKIGKKHWKKMQEEAEQLI
jgi:hypothetical protein